jgi:iron complex transport system permease protein
MNDIIISNYLKKNLIKISALIIACLLIVILFFIDIFVGSANLTFSETLSAIFAPGNVSSSIVLIVRELRIPIALMAILIGLSLGTSGSVMQTILHNPLASPYTLGIGAGASFGATIAILFQGNDFVVAGLAFLFAMIISLLIFFIGKFKKISTHTMTLLGIALLFFFKALQSFVQYFASEDQNQSIVFWEFGSLQKVDYQKVLILLVAFVIIFPLLMRNSWKYTSLSLGDMKAESLGIQTSKLKLESFILISILSALSVCFTGPIGFIGIASPHIARMISGDDHRFYLPLSGLIGAFILLFADIVSKIIMPGSIFPIGIITSLIGVPFFFVVLIKEKR